jgi:hypothetical protein
VILKEESLVPAFVSSTLFAGWAENWNMGAECFLWKACPAGL